MEQSSIAAKMRLCGWLDQNGLTKEGKDAIKRIRSTIRRNGLASPDVSLIQFTREASRVEGRAKQRDSSWVADLATLNVDREDEPLLRNLVTVAEFADFSAVFRELPKVIDASGGVGVQMVTS